MYTLPEESQGNKNLPRAYYVVDHCFVDSNKVVGWKLIKARVRMGHVPKNTCNRHYQDQAGNRYRLLHLGLVHSKA